MESLRGEWPMRVVIMLVMILYMLRYSAKPQVSVVNIFCLKMYIACKHAIHARTLLLEQPMTLLPPPPPFHFLLRSCILLRVLFNTIGSHICRILGYVVSSQALLVMRWCSRRINCRRKLSSYKLNETMFSFP